MSVTGEVGRSLLLLAVMIVLVTGAAKLIDWWTFGSVVTGAQP